MKGLINQGKRIFLAEQTSILSAASVIALMMGLSRILGYVRQRVILHFFEPHASALFFASFRLPDLIFEVLVFGTFASAFIPVFTRLIKEGNGRAWETAGRVVNIGMAIFSVFLVVVYFGAETFYRLAAPGFTPQEIAQIANLAKILFLAQGFFIVSYVMTGVLESLRRFLLPALAPVFYNLGIILGTVILSPQLGLFAPAWGVVIGAAAHFLIQLPLAYKLGFRFTPKFGASAPVKQIGRLAAPRFLDLSVQQVAKVVELNLSSLITTASYTYFTLANTLQLLPVSLFGVTVAKAALPTLARQGENPVEFRTTLLRTFYQVLFVVLPVTAALTALRIPIVRLAYGTDLFGWEATLETSLALSAFAMGIPFQAALALFNRGFYALHDTKTPVAISVVGTALNVGLSFWLVRGLGLPVWALAAAFSVGVTFQGLASFVILMKRIDGKIEVATLIPLAKILTATAGAGGIMFLAIRLFDRSAWVKRLSFLGLIPEEYFSSFSRFLLDTRYTVNLLILTLAVGLLGMGVYLLTSYLLRVEELTTLMGILRKRAKIAAKEEAVTLDID